MRVGLGGILSLIVIPIHHGSVNESWIVCVLLGYGILILRSPAFLLVSPVSSFGLKCVLKFGLAV